MSAMMELFIEILNGGCQLRLRSFSAGKTVIFLYHTHFRYYCDMFRPVIDITRHYLFKNQNCVIPCTAKLLCAVFLALSLGALQFTVCRVICLAFIFCWLRRDRRSAIFWDFTHRGNV
jgi:hypothetical protein